MRRWENPVNINITVKPNFRLSSANRVVDNLKSDYPAQDLHKTPECPAFCRTCHSTLVPRTGSALKIYFSFENLVLRAGSEAKAHQGNTAGKPPRTNGNSGLHHIPADGEVFELSNIP
jgi:hypothetical protein